MFKKLAFAGALTLAVAGLAGCNQALTTINADITAANNALANLAANDIPAACGIVSVAEGYFADVKSLVPAKAVAAEAKAAAVVAGICARPPADLGAAFATLMTAWTTIQASTTVPASAGN